MDNQHLFRYDPENNETAVAEAMVANYVGSKYAVAFNSCSSAMYIAVLTCNRAMNEVFVPAFTFTAVPSAVIHAGVSPRFINCDENYSIDLEEFEAVLENTYRLPNYMKPRMLLLSYIRGHVPDMDKVIELCVKYEITLIEDCAHAMGCKWEDQYLGTLGKVGCFSTQSAKLIKSGEGGFLVTDDDDVAARAILMAGSYEDLWDSHIVCPSKEVMKKWQNDVPCYGLRMHNGTAASVVEQMIDIEKKIEDINFKYEKLVDDLHLLRDIVLPGFPKKLRPVFDTLQFRLINGSVQEFAEKTGISYFSEPDNARAFWNWKYVERSTSEKIFEGLDCTRDIISNTFDVRLPESLTVNDIHQISGKIISALKEVACTTL